MSGSRFRQAARRLRARFRDGTPARPEAAAWLRARPWEEVALPGRVTDVPTMISPQEQALLYRLAAERFDGTGAIVDAGCFLGGSTIALAEGLEANPRPVVGRPIHTYDLFVLDETSKSQYAVIVGDLEAGESTLPRFRELMGDRLERVNVHEGDIRAQSWPGDPIDVLFVDVAKSWAINDHVNRQFLPALRPDESVLIQQDYFHEWLPWIHIGLELLGDALEFAGSLPFGSAVFVPRRSISPDEIPADLRAALPDDRKVELFDCAAGRFDGEERGILELARAVLLAEVGRLPEGRAHVEATVSAYGDHPGVTARSGAVAGYLAGL